MNQPQRRVAAPEKKLMRHYTAYTENSDTIFFRITSPVSIRSVTGAYSILDSSRGDGCGDSQLPDPTETPSTGIKQRPRYCLQAPYQPK